VRTSLRVFWFGGMTSYRALFNWLTPWILIPTFLVAPIAQILLFAYLGRSAGAGSDRFYLVGNAVMYCASPCIFAMGNTIGDERRQQTLSLLLATPARRVPLFLGRALPVIANGLLVSVFALSVGALVLGVSVPARTWGPLALAVLLAAYACTGLGLLAAAIALLVRESAVLSNIIFGVLLVFCGVNVVLTEMPGWMAGVAQGLPLTRSIAAARNALAGSGLSDIGAELARELLLGTAYVVAGVVLLTLIERQSRRNGSLDMS
jgi:ABC-2 type transport system permease protein